MRQRSEAVVKLVQCPHDFHHPRPYSTYPHSCDGCWCEGERDMREYGWKHDTTPEGGKDAERQAVVHDVPD